MQPRRVGEGFAECPTKADVVEFVDGKLSETDERSMRGHIDRCASCRRRVAEIGAGISTGSVAAAAEPSPPTRVAMTEGEIGPGTVIGGKYRVVKVLGTGGMGKVFAALHIELGQTVAIKLMHPEMLHDTDSVRRFLREGRAAALLRSDHAVRINDVGRLPSGLPYLVMEHLEGEDLDRLRSGRVLEVDEVVDYMLQALTAIGEAHDAGIVHRDLKPQNLFLSRQPDGALRVKVLDFGLAKELPSLNRTHSALTTDNMILGSPHFMSPEQIRNPTGVDARTDIWALGATMFLLLTGSVPYTSNTVYGLLARILADPPPSARSVRSDVPAAIDEIVLRCMSKDVFARFQTAGDLAAALRAAIGKESSAAAQGRPTERTTSPTGSDLPDEDGEATLVSTQVRALSAPKVVAARPASPTLVAAGSAPVTREMAARQAEAAPAPAAPFASAPHARTLPLHQMPGVAAAPPRTPHSFAPLATSAGGTDVPPARPGEMRSSRRRLWTAALVVVSVAAMLVTGLAVRAALGRDARRAASSARAITSVTPSTTPAASAESPPMVEAAPPSPTVVVAAPSASAAESTVLPHASSTSTAATTATTAKKTAKPPPGPPGAPQPPCDKLDPYSWCH
jgi:serine/threonine protein kinase